MSPGVFDAGTAEQLRERINQDGAFHQVSSDMTRNLALETDGAVRWSHFGRCAGNACEQMTARAQSAEGWARLLADAVFFHCVPV